MNLNMNLPNKLTFLRIILVPFYLVTMVLDFKYHYIAAFVVFVIASLTDFLDGRLARKNNQITVFGKLCDPLADKMLTTAAMLAFMQLGLCSIWVVMIVLTREFLITSFRLVATSQNVIIPAGKLGKVKTASQMIFSAAIMLGCHFHTIPDDTNFVIVSNVLLWITTILTAVSGIKYLIDGVKVIDFTK